MRKRVLGIMIASVFSLAMAGQSVAAGQSGPATISGIGEANAIPDRYIVVFQPGSVGHDVTAAADAAARLGGNVHYTYTDALQGFAATLSDALQHREDRKGVVSGEGFYAFPVSAR